MPSRAGDHCHQISAGTANAAIATRRGRAVSTTSGAATNIPRRVTLAPSGLATTNVAVHATA